MVEFVIFNNLINFLFHTSILLYCKKGGGFSDPYNV